MNVEAAGKSGFATTRIFASRAFWLFLFLEIGLTYAPWSVLPWGGRLLTHVFETPFSATSRWLALHLFHITGVAATDHSSDSRDTALSWILVLVVSGVSVLGSAVWTAIQSSSKEEDRLAIWFRYVLRMSLVFIMLRYGLFKLFPLQMGRPSLGVLNEPVGQTSPMTLLWTLIGLKPFYQVGSGALETLCGLLLAFERTSVLGVLMGCTIMTNVVWLNLAFDVPVKLGAIQILVAFGALLWPHAQAIAAFLLGAVPRKLEASSRPQFRSRRSIILATSFESAYVCLSLFAFVPVLYHQAALEAKAVRNPSPFSGEWKVESAKVTEQGQTSMSPLLTPEGSALTALFLEPDGRVMARSEDGRLWRASVQINPKEHSFTLDSGYFEGPGFGETYFYSMSADNEKMLLQTSPTNNGLTRQLELRRVQLPSAYPLLEERMHWIQEWAIER